jgi:hypothetical protein
MDFTETKITSPNSGVLIYVRGDIIRAFAFNLEDLDSKLLRCIVISHGQCYNVTTPLIKKLIQQISYAIDDTIEISDVNKLHKGKLQEYEIDLKSLGQLGLYRNRRIFTVCH